MRIIAREITAAIKEAPVGKHVHGKFYVHKSALDELPEVLRTVEIRARCWLTEKEWRETTVIKFARGLRDVTFLNYPNFETEDHPRLRSYVTVLQDIEWYTSRSKRIQYNWKKNPPILHRKETMVLPTHPKREAWAELTRQEEEAGLLGQSSIGNVKTWAFHLEALGYRIVDGKLVRRT